MAKTVAKPMPRKVVSISGPMHKRIRKICADSDQRIQDWVERALEEAARKAER